MAERALAFTPAYSLLHINLGVAYGGAGRPADAEREFQTAILLAPGDYRSHYFYGRWLRAVIRAALISATTTAAPAASKIPSNTRRRRFIAPTPREPKDSTPAGREETTRPIARSAPGTISFPSVSPLRRGMSERRKVLCPPHSERVMREKLAPLAPFPHQPRSPGEGLRHSYIRHLRPTRQIREVRPLAQDRSPRQTR